MWFEYVSNKEKEFSFYNFPIDKISNSYSVSREFKKH